MQKLLVRSGAGLLLFALAGSFMWYGVLTNRIAAKDRGFVINHNSARFFPETSYWSGNAFYSKKDPAAASRKYREAIARQPLFIDAWLGLIKAQMRLGNMSEAHRLFLALAPVLTQTSYWKWKELLLAYDLEEDAWFEEAFNSILARSPDRIEDACKIGRLKWGGWDGVITHASSANLPALMKPLLDARSIDDLLRLWAKIKEAVEIKDKNLLLSGCDFALENGKLIQAKEMWNAWLGKKHLGIYDGNFDMQPTNSGLGWRICEHPQVQTEYSSLERYGANRSLHFRFMGTENISYSHVSQVVPVEPGKNYTLTFARKSRNIDTDQGVFLKVSGFKCASLQVRSAPITGTNPWAIEKVNIAVPDNCEAVQLQVCREESFKLDSKISGDYWLDSVALQEAD